MRGRPGAHAVLLRSSQFCGNIHICVCCVSRYLFLLTISICIYTTIHTLKVETNKMESDQEAASENPSDGSSVRSYECNFCKRGFSNAQALGGHMNIHRKDKAKLKQQQDQTKPGEKTNIQKWNWNVSQQEHVSSPIHTRQLPLFAESPTSSETQKPQVGQTTTEQPLLSTQNSSSELDLELRLGPEPEPQDSSAETGTRFFF
ncbi:hypothetical protein VNO78_05486 [Psophocarpus tetragonolobus]|uniref:C2H2-type domain-containing protein n=1 Tax=Psophocarpus tetragonolobus TaxID=3891 RepID=A0AAN9STQ1_PSOTE